ncbi:MAG: type I restriction enzyme HsdR N-terminal domain-containing protein [Desulfarculaceae bacterium]|nr:type I restriction enzyme HsdR N-terminal domain-containing protein [Desulfarculaceae bacterium]MCF8070896.1 type I restriction enzyme HsdR N-terminal domain-containing protein [Desulfarculaceae bacterium]MCF8100484.1 type I restriction enzyme HsdR N-terminal domain-containing protein [Desulfarculaceae bacterium]MCF8118091.1 type I restriction enzyme HsdR N-terminal domain-containing protein [Desulfarculaceae bacterium]
MSASRDLITGLPLTNSEDEPVRQDIEALLLKLGHPRGEIAVDASRNLGADLDHLLVVADLLVSRARRAAMVLRCARGSIVTREKEAVACARLIAPQWAPLAVATNGKDAELIETASGEVMATGLAAIPSPESLDRLLAGRPPTEPTPKQMAQAARVYSAYSQFHCEAYCR